MRSRAQVVAAIGGDDGGVDRLGLAAEADVDRRGPVDDVGVREDLAVGRHDDAGADGAAELRRRS